MTKQQNYKYVIELTAPIWPRKLADDLSATHDIFPHLVSVTDLQNDGHSYGGTYTITGDHRRLPLTPLSWVRAVRQAVVR